MSNISTFSFGQRNTERVVFRETFAGDGSTLTYQLTGNIGNATFVIDTWEAMDVLITLPAYVTGTDSKSIYDSIIPIYRDLVTVASISASGLVTLAYAPRNGVSFYVWYWYELDGADKLDDYYREDFVTSIEGGSESTTTISLDDTDGSDTLTLSWDENDTASRSLKFKVTGASRTMTLSGDPTLADWFDQNLKAIASPAFAGMTLTGFSGFVKATAGVLSAVAPTLDELDDAIISSPTKNQALLYNGTSWVNAAQGASFTFSCVSFLDGETTTQLAGSGVWKAAEAMSYTTSYLNGPPTSADVKMSINGGTYNDVGHMTGPAYTAGKNYDGAINYPTVDQYLRFRLDSSDGVDSDIDYDTAIYFYNYIYYGDIAVGSGFTEANVESLTGTISSSYTTSRAINAGVGEYVVVAYPARYTSIHVTGMIFNSVTMPFTAPETVSITNSAGLTENYKVFASTLTNLGNSTLQLSTSSTTINSIYYGGSTKSGTYLEANVEGLDQSSVTNDETQTWTAITLDASEYFIFAMPSRLTTPAFYDNTTGFEAAFIAPETVAVTNVNGYTENYKVFRSENILGPGSFTLRTA